MERLECDRECGVSQDLNVGKEYVASPLFFRIFPTTSFKHCSYKPLSMPETLTSGCSAIVSRNRFLVA